jgi:hypothetical protein
MRVPIRGASSSVVLNASGNGTAKVGPISARETWYPANAHVAANSGSVINEAQCLIYTGTSVGPNNFRDGTLSGSSGDSTDAINHDEVKQGEYIWAVWAGGDTGVTATLNVTGMREV